MNKQEISLNLSWSSLLRRGEGEGTILSFEPRGSIRESNSGEKINDILTNLSYHVCAVGMEQHHDRY